MTEIARPFWRGINHLALITNDMDATTRFWAGVPDRRKMQFDHLSFNLPDEHALEELQSRLKSHSCGVTDVIDHGFVRSIYFNDPNGIALEASWWVVDPTGRIADYSDPTLFSDPNPVPAVRELTSDGVLASVPQTTLSSDEI